MRGRLGLSCAVTAIGIAIAAPVRAQDDPALGPDPRRLDVFQGPVQGSSRAVGLAGAYSSIAEGIEGALWNPAAVGNRYPYSMDWWDWDLDGSLGLLLDATKNLDYDNDGKTSSEYDFFRFGNVGGSLSFGYLAFGVEANFQWYRLRVPLNDGTDAMQRADVTLATVHADAAFGLLRGQLVAGLGARLAGFTFETESGLTDRIDDRVGEQNAGIEAGILIRPNRLPFRFAAVVRSPMAAAVRRISVQDDPDTAANEEQSVGDCSGSDLPPYSPCEVALPWEVALGFSWMFGPRVYNEPWVNPNADKKRLRRELEARQQARWNEQQERLTQLPPEQHAAETSRLEAQEQRTRAQEDRALLREVRRLQRERRAAYDRAPRRYVLVSGDLVITGPTQNAIGLEAFVRQQQQASGEDISLTPRLGVESELWHDRLRLRGGGYLEPSRFRDGSLRPHGTFGFDLRLFYTTVFDLLSRFGVRASGVVDYAPRYFQVSASVGIWH